MKWEKGIIALMLVETLLVTVFIATYLTRTDPFINLGGSLIIFNVLIFIFLLVNSLYCWHYLGLGRSVKE